MDGDTVRWKLHDPNFSRFCMNHPCDRQTDRQTDRRNCDSICALTAYMLSRAKIWGGSAPLRLRNRSPKKSIFNRFKLRSCFSPFVNQSSPDYVSIRGRDRSLQRRFPRRPKSCRKKHVFGPQFFGGRTPNFGSSFQNCTHFRYVAKFRGDRPRDRGDLALNKKNSSKT